jgi:hypothetical protein
MCEVTTISRPCGSATAGLICMYIIGIDDVINIPSANDDWIIEDDILLEPAKFFKQIFFREQKAGLADELADAVGGGFKKNVGLFIPKYGNKSNQWIYNMIGTRFIMLVQDFNDQTILVGNLTSPMRMEKAMGNTGQKMGDDSGWAVNLIAESNRPCYLYEGDIVMEGTTPTTFIAYWGWQSIPFTQSSLVTFNFQKVGQYPVDTTSIPADFTTASVNNYLALKYPVEFTPVTAWKNTDFNYGEIPDQIFYPLFTSDGFSYAYTRVVPVLDKNNKQIIFS